VLGASDALDGVECLDDRLDVGGEAPVGVPGVRVAPGDHEDLLTLLYQVLDQAAPRCEVDGVELVDRRWDDEHRRGAHRLGLRPVLDQLQDLGPVHHRARCDRDVAAHLETRRVDHLRNARCAQQVPGKVSSAAHEVRTAGVDGFLRRLRVHHRNIARRHGFGEVQNEEPHATLVAPIQLGQADQLLRGTSGHQVGLDNSPQPRIVRPRRVGEATVPLGRRQVRRACADADQLGCQRSQPLPGLGRAGEELAEELCRRRVRGESARATERAFDEQRVQRRGELVGLTRTGHVCTSSVISRLRIFPVGPLGSAAMICR
jgi:hypothetical protein